MKCLINSKMTDYIDLVINSKFESLIKQIKAFNLNKFQLQIYQKKINIVIKEFYV